MRGITSSVARVIGPPLAVVAVAAVLLAAIYFLFTGSREIARKLGAAPPTTSAPSDTLLAVGGTGTLEQTELVESSNRLRYVLVGPMSPQVELGVVDEYTNIDDFATGATYRGTGLRQFLGKRITVMAVVRARMDDQSGFSPLRAIRITVLPRTSEVIP